MKETREPATRAEAFYDRRFPFLAYDIKTHGAGLAFERSSQPFARRLSAFERHLSPYERRSNAVFKAFTKTRRYVFPWRVTYF